MKIHGKLIDAQTRCVHYHTPLDIIAIKFKCCNLYYACYYCHEEQAGHVPEVWPKSEFTTEAVICGSCKTAMSIAAYKDCNYQCPHCKAPFNPRCMNHNHLYFEV